MNVFKLSTYCWLLGSLMVICMLVSPLPGKAAQGGAVEVITIFNATLLQCMKRADELGFSGRYALLESVMKESFALSFMAEKSAGRHWRKLDEEQRKLLVDTYTAWSIANYARRFDEYAGERFDVLPEIETVRNTVTVISTLTKQDGDTVDFHYKLRELEGEWRIVDIHISGVSQLANTRAQFLSVLNTTGFDDLISKLQHKIEVFSGEAA